MEILSTTDKVVKVIYKEMTSRGWEPVRDKASGIFIKNNCIFVLHQVKQNNKYKIVEQFIYDEDDIKELVEGNNPHIPIADALSVLYPKGCSWHIEKFGWLLDKGSINRYTSDLYDYTEEQLGSSYLDVQTMFNNFDRYSNMDSAELRSVKTREVLRKDDAEALVAVPTTENIGTTRTFKVIDKSLSGYLEYDRVYRVIDVNETSASVSLYSKDLKILEPSDTIEITLEILSTLFNRGLIAVVEITKGENTVLTREWVSPLKGKAVALPEVFDDFQLDNKSRSILSIAYGHNYNYTPLLSNINDESSMKVMLKFMHSGFNTKYFINKHLTEEQLEVLYGISSQGYDIDELVVEDYTAEYIKMLLDEKVMILSRIEDSLKNEGYTPEQIKVITKVAFKGKGFQHVKKDLPPIVLDMIDYSKTHSLLKLSSILTSTGIIDSNTIYASWSLIPDDSKDYLLNILCHGFIEDRNSWTEKFKDILSKARYLQYMPNVGFVVRTSQYFIGWDYNSIFISNLGNVVVWRAIFVNNTVLLSEEFPCVS